jgi:transposase-like protein
MDIKNKIVDENALDEASGGKTIGQGYRKQYRCDDCGMVFERKSELNLHQQETKHLKWSEVNVD